MGRRGQGGSTAAASRGMSGTTGRHPQKGGGDGPSSAGPRGGVARRALTVAPALGGHNVLSRAAGLGAAVAAACGTSVAHRGSASSAHAGP